MSELHRLPDITEVEREASEWIARLNADDVSVEDRERFETWHAAHPSHARAYAALSGTWNRFTAAGPFIRAVSFANSMKDSESARTPLRRGAVLAAAAFVVCVTAWTWFYVAKPRPDTAYQTAIGEHASIPLPDGSILELNSNSAARVDYYKTARVIHLVRGEAFFNVAHDTQRPFWVVAGTSWVRAVGTAFDVYLKQTDVVVTVSEGTVKVGSGDASAGDVPSDTTLARTSTAVVTAGHQADLRLSILATRKLSSTEIARSVGWRQGTLHFENRPLNEVIQELNRYTNLQIEVEDKNVGDLLVGGTFQASPDGSEAMLAMLQQGFGISVRREGDRAYIQAAPAQSGNKEPEDRKAF